MNVFRFVLVWCGASVFLALGLGRLLTVSDASGSPGWRRARRSAAFVSVGVLALAVPLSGRGGALLEPPAPVEDVIGTVTTLVSGPSTTTTTTPTPPTTSPTTATTRPPTEGGSPPARSDASPAGGSSTRTGLGSSASAPPAVAATTDAAAGAVTTVLDAVVGPNSAVPAPLGPAIDLSAVVPLGEFGGPRIPAGPRSTAGILAMLEDLDLPPATLARILAPFPVAGAANYSDDWGAPRLTPRPHAHEGVDVFAARGTPVIASADGIVERRGSAGAGGLSVRLAGRDGTVYYYAHLDRIAPAAQQGARLAKGQVLGFVGTTGNAEGGIPHLHFEIHPDGGGPVPPVPYLDRWLADATDTAQALLRAPEEAIDAVRSGRITAAAGLGPGLAPLERAAATRGSSAAWPLVGAALVALLGWRLVVRRLRRPAHLPPPPPPAGFFDLG